MKILLLTDRLETGGAETHIAQLATGLRRMGVDITLLSSGGNTADMLEAQGFRHIRFPIHTHNPLRWLLLRRDLIRLQRREKFDILHAHARIPALLLRGFSHRDCAVAVTVHARFSITPLLRRMCYWGERTVAVSEDLRTYVTHEYRVPAERVRVIPNGIDCTCFCPNAPRSVFPQEPRTLRILFASRLDRDCSLGAELLLRIAPSLLRRFPDVRIGIAGGGSDFSRIATLAAETNRIIGTDAVTLYGQVKDMASLLREQDIFIGVSRAAMEASACGCAVILCGNEGYLGVLNGDTMRQAALSNFCCRDAHAADIYCLQNDLVFLLSRPDLRAQYAADARAELLTRFGAERMCRETLMLYHRMLKKSPVRTLLIGGYFGCRNLGDDAILSGFLEGMHTIAPDIRIIALTGKPRRDAKHFDIPCVNRRNPIKVAHAMLRADVFLCGGGSLLQNSTSNRSLSYYLHLIGLAKRLGAHPMLYAAGIGPLYGERARRRTAKALATCTYISLRDLNSMLAVEALGVDRAKLHLGADPALLMPLPPISRKHAQLQGLALPETARYLCVILKGGTSSIDTRRIIIAAARMLCRRHGLRPLFPILDRAHDTDAARDAAKQLHGRVVTFAEPADATALFTGAALVITMRLHAMILSTAASTPAIGIPADPADEKILSFANPAGQPAIRREDLSVAHLVEKAERVLTENSTLRPFFESCTSDLRKKAKKDLENITAMIYNINSKQ
ncbi:MAG: glycosyltransferase [Clostridia bacterium]|nr:glycosyltransferase [Clostridia bacterium]